MNKTNCNNSWIEHLIDEAKSDPNCILLLSSSRPIVGVQLEISGRLKTKNGEIPISYLQIKYNISKCTKIVSCSLPKCLKVTVNEPLRCAELRCLLCGNQPGASRMIFCSHECLKVHLNNVVHNNQPITCNLRDWCDNLINSQSGDMSTNNFLPCDTEYPYVPTKEDVGRSLKVEVIASINHQIIATETIDTLMTFPRGLSPQPRVYMTCKQKPYMQYPIRLASYNILAEVYCTQSFCPSCPEWARMWSYRRDNVLRDLISMKADVICLQEVQFEHYKNFLKPELAKLNYSALYKQKTRDGLEDKIDGCATFYKTDKFDLITTSEMNFNDLAREQFPGQYPTMKRLMHDNIAQIVHFRYKYPGDIPADIIIANTHIYWDPHYSDVKLWQTYKLLEALENYQAYPIILCGDFNSTLTSAVYTFLTETCVSQAHPDLSNDPLSILASISPLKHNLPLQSAYKAVLGSEPQTNYTSKFKGSLDYIFYTPGPIEPYAVLTVPSETDLLKEIGSIELPNPIYPSDHLPLCFVFDILPQVIPQPLYLPPYY